MNKKIIFSAIAIFIVIVVGIAAGYYYISSRSHLSNQESKGQSNEQTNQQENNEDNSQKEGIITYKEPKLTDEQRQIIETRLSDYQKELSEKKALSNAEKLDLNLKIGFQYYALGKYLDAKKYYLAAAEYDSESPAPYLALHQLYIDMNDNEEALNSINKAISLRPAQPDYLKRRIVLMEERFNATKEKIDEMYQDALKVTNYHIDIIASYAKFLEKSGNIQKAIEFWGKAGVINPDNKAAYDKEVERLENLLAGQR